MKLYEISEGLTTFTVYDDKLKVWFNGQLIHDRFTYFPGVERAQNQIDRFSTDFDKDLRTVIGKELNLRNILRVWKKKVARKLTGKLKSFEEERYPQFSPRSKYLQQVGWQRYLLEGIPLAISEEASAMIPEAINAIKDSIIVQLPKGFKFKLPTFEELLAEINQQATSGLPWWQTQKLLDKDGNPTDFYLRVKNLYERFTTKDLQHWLPHKSKVTPGSRSQAKEPNIPGIRAIFIPDEDTKIASEIVELIISPLKKLIFQMAYRSPEQEYKEYTELAKYAKLKRARIASIDLSRWDTTVSHEMIDAAYQVLIDLVSFFMTGDLLEIILNLLESARDTMLNAEMYVDLGPEKYVYFDKQRGVISGHGNTSSVGTLIHWLQDIIIELIYYMQTKESILSYDKTQYIADDARTVIFKSLDILSELYRKHFSMFLRPDSMVDRSIVEFKQRLYLPGQKIGLVSITRLLNSLFRLERVIRGKPTRTDWSVRNIQIGNDAADHPLREWFWRFIKEHDKYIYDGIGKKSDIFARFHELPEQQQFVTWLLRTKSN